METIKKINEINNKVQVFPYEENEREVLLASLKDCILADNSLFYPNVLLKSLHSNEIYQPIEEEIMSLKLAKKDNPKISFCKTKNTEEKPVFFFIYNTDNYFHFIYDSIP